MQVKELVRLAVISIAFFWIGLGAGSEGLTAGAVRTGAIGTAAALAAFALVWFVGRGGHTRSDTARQQR